MKGSVFNAMVEAISKGDKFALALLSGVKGSSPQKKGAKALFFEDGRIEGTLGGGCLEAEVRRRAFSALRTGVPETFDLLLDHDFGWDDGLICGGKVYGLILPQPAAALPIWEKAAARQESFAWGVQNGFEIALAPADQTEGWLHHEIIHPQCALWIAGSGHIAQAVAPLAARLDFRVTVFDDRPALANPQYFPKESELRVDYWEKLLKDPVPDVPTFGLIVTRGHQHDAMVLREWIQQPFAFLGMIGSKRKKKIIFSHFVEEGVATEEQLQQVACPVGLDIDAVSVEEIGISIASQLVQKRSALRSAP